MLGEGGDGSLAGARESAAGTSVRVVVRDARIAGGDLVLLAALFGELVALMAAGSCAGGTAVVVFSATTVFAGGGDVAGLEVDDATRGCLSDMAWSYTNAPPITPTTIVPKAIPK